MKRVECLDESFKKKKLMKIIFKVDIQVSILKWYNKTELTI